MVVKKGKKKGEVFASPFLYLVIIILACNASAILPTTSIGTLYTPFSILVMLSGVIPHIFASSSLVNPSCTRMA